MAGQRAGLLPALLLLHLLLLAAAKRQRSPRGWKAAKQAEELRAAADAAAAAGAWAPAAFEQLPQAMGFQQACAAPWQQQQPAPQSGWGLVAAAAAVAFVLGILAGVALHIALLRRRRRRRGRSPHLEHLEGAASCAGGELELEKPPVKAAQPQPDGAAAGTAAAASSSQPQQPQQQQHPEEAEGSTPGNGTAAPQPAEEADEVASKQTAPAGAALEPAMVAAVQELVLQQSGGSASSASASAGSTAAPAAAASQAGAAALQQEPGGLQPAEQQQQQQQHAPQGLPLAAGAGGSPGEAAAGALAQLRPEDGADIAAAAQLVLTLCRSMHVDPAQLSPGERLQLMFNVLSAWQAQQGRRHAQDMSRLGSEANLLRSQQRDIAAAAAARAAARDAYRLSLERTAAFRAMCSDTLTFGLVVMVAAGAYQLVQRGLLASFTAACPALGAATGARWGLWAAWRAGEALACYAFSIGDALLGLGVLLAAPWLVYRSGLMSDYHTMPVSKLFTGLGLVCGLAGFLAVGKLGGSRAVWLGAWEAWVALHIAFSAAAHRMQRVSLRAQQGGASAADTAAMYEPSSGWLQAAMWALLGVALPLAAGTLPFRQQQV